MFQFIFNLLITIGYSLWSIVLTVVTGKIPKVSAYHYSKTEIQFWNICSDDNIKTHLIEYVSKETKRRIIQDFIHHLESDRNFTAPICTVDYPIFDGLDIVGTSTYGNVLYKSFKTYLNSLK